jgi:hypothetical protein
MNKIEIRKGKMLMPLIEIEQGGFFEKDGLIFLRIYDSLYKYVKYMDVFCITTKTICPMDTRTLVVPLPHIKIVIEELAYSDDELKELCNDNRR